MNSIYAAIKFANSNRYYISDICFSDDNTAQTGIQGLHNSSLLPESQVARAFSSITDLSETNALDLLRGVKSIHDFPALSYCVPRGQMKRIVESGIYFYDLPNGIYVVGLDETHEVVKYLKGGNDIASLTFNQDVSGSLCETKSRKKRHKNHRGGSCVICTVFMPHPVDILLPTALEGFAVVELNIALTSDPSLLATVYTGWIALLMDNSRTRRSYKAKKH